MKKNQISGLDIAVIPHLSYMEPSCSARNKEVASLDLGSSRTTESDPEYEKND